MSSLERVWAVDPEQQQAGAIAGPRWPGPRRAVHPARKKLSQQGLRGLFGHGSEHLLSKMFYVLPYEFQQLALVLTKNRALLMSRSPCRGKATSMMQEIPEPQEARWM